MSDSQAQTGDQSTPISASANSTPQEPTTKPIEVIETIVIPKSPDLPSSDLMSLVSQAIQAELQAGKSGIFEKLVSLRDQQLQQEQEERREERRLREKEINNKHELALKVEDRQTKADVASKNNIRLMIATFAISFLASVGYATFSKDATLADRVWTGTLGLVAGGGGVAAIRAKKSNEQDPDQP
ncbi:hypothetical protein [Alkalinema sp. FACHB-956]|uniref:hypothetical protein n=1 Tax=Alkalinema sp. FACHB-956 TaxID=2692768 RepID=UPI001683953C|nr:hypothetical protein [Alkalinema sp. FACHB-956]MBD2327086.1 hypothetical protein [Alkalinema sp. FACHB-956]